MPAAALDVVESQKALPYAVAAAALLSVLFAAAAIVRGHPLLWIASALCVLILGTVFSASRKPPRLLLRITPEGFHAYRRWDLIRGRPYRSFAADGMFFPWKQFSAVTIETRNAAFVGNTQERVLRLKPRSVDLDRRWSQDADDPDFLIQASEQSLPETELLTLFEKAIGTGRLESYDLTRSPMSNH